MTVVQLPPSSGWNSTSASGRRSDRSGDPLFGESDGRLPIAIGVAIFISSIGALIDFTYMYYIQMLLVPMTVFGYALLGIGAKPVRDIRIEIWIFPILFWTIMAIGWTRGDPKTATSVVLLNLMLVVCVHLAASIFDARGVLVFLAKASVVMALLVLLDAVARPGVAFSPGISDVGLEDLGLRSFFYQKNSLGAALVLGFAIRAALKQPWLRVGYTSLVVVLLALCQSSTSIIAAAAIAAMQWLSARVIAERRRGGSGSTFIISGLTLAAVTLVVAARDQIFGIFGKDSTLTGRTVIWRYSWRAIQEHLWVGYGPGGFWDTTSNGLSELRQAAGWTVIGSHQGLLDQWLEYGAIGVVLVIVAFAACAFRIGSRILAGDTSPVVPAALGMWTATVTASLTEGVLIRPGLVTIGLVSALLLNTPPSLAPKAAQAATDITDVTDVTGSAWPQPTGPTSPAPHAGGANLYAPLRPDRIGHPSTRRASPSRAGIERPSDRGVSRGDLGATSED
jgi:O-antigen ligase